jgi:hypothetical protein
LITINICILQYANIRTIGVHLFLYFAASELGKLGHLWWSGKTAMIGNDALLNHDYMLSSNSTRDDDAGGAGTALSVSTTTSDTAGGGDASTNTTNSSSMSPPPPVSPPDPINTTTTTVVQQPRSYSEWRQRMLDRSGVASQSELGMCVCLTQVNYASCRC